MEQLIGEEERRGRKRERERERENNREYSFIYSFVYLFNHSFILLCRRRRRHHYRVLLFFPIRAATPTGEIVHLVEDCGIVQPWKAVRSALECGLNSTFYPVPESFRRQFYEDLDRVFEDIPLECYGS